MNRNTTLEADPSGAASFLRNWKSQLAEEERLKEEEQETRQYNPDQYDRDWFGRDETEVYERLGRSSLWDNPSPVGRGLDYEHLVGVNIGGNHPVIDDVRAYEGIVTSIKSMDTHNSSYQNPYRILEKGRECVDAFEDFTGVDTKEGYKLPRDQIRGFHLEIAVRNDLLPEQKDALIELQKYGEEKGVRVIIAEVA